MTAQSLPDIGAPLRRWSRPTRLSFLVFAAKVAVFRARRVAFDLLAGAPKLTWVEGDGFTVQAGASLTPLWSDQDLAERDLQLGKVQNLRVAGRALDGVVLPAGAVFSFWRQVGPPIAARGFVPGRMLQQGCMVEAVGGGLCQLSNALYDAALQAGCRIVERHAHSAVVPGSAAAIGRDATVAWNYVDLRFACERDLRLTVRMDQDSLDVRLLARAGVAAPGSRPAPQSLVPPAPSGMRSCGGCEETNCFLHRPGDEGVASSGRRAFLVDDAWPELQAYVRSVRGAEDRLGRPLDGAALGLARHAWEAQGFGRAAGAPVAALSRALALRVAGRQGAARRAAELDAARRIAASLARLLTPDVTAVTLAQSYLPHLWRAGHLGGREFSVLMTRLPMAVLQSRLDRAAEAHPDRPSLADFRAPAWLARAEEEALAQAARIVTPHAEIAALFGSRVVHLPWATPPTADLRVGPVRRIAFAGPTVARKGAFAVRQAAIALGLEVMPLGAELEGPDFWRGVAILPSGDWTAVDAVVQPALVEDQPRRLLAALAAGLPVIASAACGLGPRPGLILVAPDDPEALIEALRGMPSSVDDAR